LEPVRIGIIGCGVIGSHHIDAAMKDDMVDLVAIADLKEDLGQEKAKTNGIPKVYVEGLDLLEDDSIEGIVLALPACWRGVLAKRAFERGIHVLTEKPVGMNGTEVRELIEARGDLIAGSCCSRYRFPASANAVTDFIASGVLGDLRVIHCRALRPGGPPPAKAPPIWRLRTDLNGGGIMSNWGCYDLDYLLGVTGWTLKPRVVFGQTWTVPPRFEAMVDPSSDAETHLVATIQCDNNIAIHYERGEMVTATPRLSWGILGTDGSLDLEMVKAEKKIEFHKAVSSEGVVTETLWEGTDELDPVHDGPIGDFARAIREGQQPKTSLEQALVVQEITDAIYTSAKAGRSVEIPD
jgi:UDP-N-acetyl-2-amino-2-deoxyglucuronate dehydrogenase